MRCPQCQAEGLDHQFHASATRQGPGPIGRFWDQKDRLHIHDEGPYHTRFCCDNGHQFDELKLALCPQLDCDWNKRPDVAGILRRS